MAEATLSITKTTLDQAIGRFVGFTATKGSWTTDDLAIVNMARAAGLRLFYNPPALPGQKFAHAWRFLRPIGSLSAWASVDAVMSGVPSYVDPVSTVTATTSVFYPTMVGFDLVFDTGGNSYPIAEYVDATHVKVTGDASGETSGDGFIITATGDYQMPDDFGVIQGELTFPAGAAYHPDIPVVGEQVIREKRQGSATTGVPRLAALSPLASSNAAGQRWRLSLWPTPNAMFELSFRYHVLQNDLVDSTNEHPLGGQAHAQTIIAACLAAAEQQEDGAYGPKYQDFLVKLGTSIAHDARSEPTFLGYMGDRSDEVEADRRGRCCERPIVTYNGVEI